MKFKQLVVTGNNEEFYVTDALGEDGIWYDVRFNNKAGVLEAKPVKIAAVKEHGETTKEE